MIMRVKRIQEEIIDCLDICLKIQDENRNWRAEQRVSNQHFFQKILRSL